MNRDQSGTAVMEKLKWGKAGAGLPGEPENLAEAAVESIRETEHISGFGRFMLKVQGLFQEKSSSPSTSAGHWRAAPVLIGAGLVLILGFGILLLLSKPQEKAGRYFRPTESLTGAEDREPLPAAAYVPPPVAESQLVGEEFATKHPFVADKQSVPNGVIADGSSPRSFSTRAAEIDPAELVGAALAAGLNAPATVFVAAPPRPDTPKANLNASRGEALQLPVGTQILAHTTNAISSGLDSPVVAVVDQAVRLGGVLFIPQGSRAIGYTAGASKDRVNVRFTALVLPDNRQIEFSGLALMKDGSAGLVGKIQGKGRPVLAGAGRVATGAAVLATQFAGRSSNSLNQPFSQADYLRNQLAAEIAAQGNQFSNRVQAPLAVPIVSVPANESIRIFVMASIRLANGQDKGQPGQKGNSESPVRAQKESSADELLAMQAAYIQMLEAQLAELRAAMAARPPQPR